MEGEERGEGRKEEEKREEGMREEEWGEGMER
jgi:hypothetical protein